MIYGGQLLTIQHVANGFIVTLPEVYEEPKVDYGAMIDAIKDLTKDPMLKGIEEEPKTEEKKKPAYQATNIHIFDTWEKVLAFLSKLG